MARVLSHSWDNRKERRINGRHNGWTRRMRWYCASWSEREKDVRICFDDEFGLAHKVYGDRKDDAERDWNDFRNKALTTTMLLRLSEVKA